MKIYHKNDLSKISFITQQKSDVKDETAREAQAKNQVCAFFSFVFMYFLELPMFIEGVNRFLDRRIWP